MSQPTDALSPKRHMGIDLFRVVSFVAVVAVHARGFYLGPRATEFFLLVPRFAVPYFFLVAGYFLSRKTLSLVSMAKLYLTRLLPVFAGWLLIYLLAHGLIFGDSGIMGVRQLLVEGVPAYHLWFLPSLGVSAVMFALCLKVSGIRGALVAGILLYCLGVPFVELNMEGPLHWNFRDGPFFGCIFIAIGYWIGKSGPSLTIKQSVSIASAGFLLQCLESFLLWRFFQVPPTSDIDYFISTVPYAVGIFFLALGCQSRVPGTVAKLGEKTLGAYCIHLLFLWMVQTMFAPSSIARVLITITIVSIASLIASNLMSKIKLLSLLVE
ncbi:Surface polysaccharide O-acyltransferase, integral membrane enzyme [Rhizobium mongolense subsp. loessense]|uniref:Surface polysaccharide O-acyltransferase, integral membrane enzyme n=1 Tax=Rhizobium mongolense subsp. loessense TaxID=158890 RepID=A0A1G4RUJ3_9HYPH|nr:acyltransferase [Rhizobium mongolense]SCW60682.1 Surface polysaccharide O-acyltransferase, integral membrane enzyme [Rhizobium mongolense subsp. loessense]